MTRQNKVERNDKRDDMQMDRVPILNQREILMMRISHYLLTYGRANSKAIYEYLQRHRTIAYSRSHSYVYQIIREMTRLDYTTSKKEGRCVFYEITQFGQRMFHSIHTDSLKEVERIQHCVAHIYTCFQKWPSIAEYDKPLTSVSKRYISTLINAREVVRLFTLRYLLQRNQCSGAELYEMLKQSFGWAVGNGYFYELLREMRDEQLISGKWDNDDRRNERTYSIREEGIAQISLYERKVSETLQIIQKEVKHLKTLIEEYGLKAVNHSKVTE